MPRRLDEIIVHIGFPKTASSSIQKSLAGNSQRLEAEHDVLYPNMGRGSNHHAPLILGFGPAGFVERVALLRGLGSKRELAAAREAALEALERCLDDSLARRAVLSAENLSHFRPEDVERFASWIRLRGDVVRIIACLRHPSDLVSSSVQQRVKGGEVLGEMNNLEAIHRFELRLGSWLDVFGRGAMTVYDFEEARRHPGGPVGRFTEAAELPAGVLDTDAQPIFNSRLSQPAVEMLSALNRRRPRFDESGVAPLRTPRDAGHFEAIVGPRYRAPRELQDTYGVLPAQEAEWLRRELGFEFSPRPEGARDAPPPAQLDPATLESTALLISDLAADAFLHRKLLIGASYLEQGRYEDALSPLREAARVQPDHPRAHNLLRRAYAMLGRRREAANARARHLELKDRWRKSDR